MCLTDIGKHRSENFLPLHVLTCFIFFFSSSELHARLILSLFANRLRFIRGLSLFCLFFYFDPLLRSFKSKHSLVPFPLTSKFTILLLLSLTSVLLYENYHIWRVTAVCLLPFSYPSSSPFHPLSI